MQRTGISLLRLLMLASPCCTAMQTSVHTHVEAVDSGLAASQPRPLYNASAALSSHHRVRLLFGVLGKDRDYVYAEAARRRVVPESVCTDGILVQGPWVAFRCFRAAKSWQETLSLIGASSYVWGPTDEFSAQYLKHPFNMEMMFAVVIFIMGVGFAIFSIKDVHRFVMLLVQASVQRQQEQAKEDLLEDSKAAAPVATADAAAAEAAPTPQPPQRWSFMALAGLTAYRFYTGFLSATWMPYLLAMEGQDLWPEQQSIFMGFAKLIYGVTILMNPIFGRVGDHAVSLSHGVGRRLFVRLGITLAALGIYICVLSAKDRLFLSFLSGVLVWRLGEALNDVTTEALVPEMVPQDQYQTASGIKASSFLLGGLFGYTLLLVYADAHYDWLYYAYPIGMFTCSLPALFLLDKDHPFPKSRQQSILDQEDRDEESFLLSLTKAYTEPMNYKGGFPRACLAVFIFGLGTAPMFFLLLIVRDLVGIRNAVAMQEHFSIGSIFFFLAAAIASVLIALVHAKKPPRPATRPQAAPSEASEAQQSAMTGAQSTERHWAAAEVMEQRGRMLTIAMCTFGIIILLIPCLGLIKDSWHRDRAYYIMTVCFGFSFGVSFSLFQDLTWQMLPPEVNFATAMGFNVMSRLAGVGLGNFLCGLILEMSYDVVDGMVVYSIAGYVIMCTLSGIAILVSTAVATSAIKLAKQADIDDRAKHIA